MNFTTVYEKSKQMYVSKTPNSEKAFERSQRYMPGGDTRTICFYKPYPITIQRGQGAYLFDVDGNRYVDFLNNYTSMIHGHAHPFIMEKVQSALSLGTAYAAAIPEQAELAEILCRRVPSVEKIRFCNSGTEATMFAIRAARAFTGKTAIIKMEGGYHGTHDLVEYSISPSFNHPSGELPWTPIPECEGLSENVARDVYIAPFNNAEAVEEILLSKSAEIAAILVEPVMGVAGVIPPKTGYLEQLRKLATQFQVLLIFDEVQSLRLAWGGAQEKYHVLPDLTAMAKIIGGGFPVGAFGGRKEIMDLFDPNQERYLSQGGTFNGNRISMAAGKASMELLDHGALQRLEVLADELETKMNDAIKKIHFPASITRVGSMLNVHFTKEPPFDYASKKSPNNELMNLMHIKLLNHGIFSAPRGMWNLSTAMVQEDIEEGAHVFASVIQEMAEMVHSLAD